ncbi:MAG: hypothetical protein D6690_13345 [Nitrospirae bacterium]|nr:MAG: hypothetical protein D6690_13345 [Nitrospirota bacterium]
MSNDRNLIELEAKLVRLIQETPDIERKQELRNRLNHIQTTKERLIGKNLEAAGEEYETATVALREANQSLTETLDDISKINQTLTKVAKVAEALSKVAEKLT